MGWSDAYIARRVVFNRFDSKGKMPYSFELISQIKGTADFIWDLESSIHKLLGQHSYTPELSFSGQSECFSQISKDVLLLIDSFSTSTS